MVSRLPKWYVTLVISTGLISLVLAFTAAAFENYLLQAIVCLLGAAIVSVTYLRVEVPLLQKRKAAGENIALSKRAIVFVIAAGLLLGATGLFFSSVNESAAHLAIEIGAVLTVGASAVLAWLEFMKKQA
ncbi:hypothetical protein [Leucobacter sp. OH1287]|uniref:hypothetical protein n=1 Tax=Leucobacter sp. OH1287 TaxID=2491049 RepID=UPI000F5DA81C|nr:hypothetical protein [Leucobacter sp. OH1287]RRD61028.1 hypothetical protein EII30_04230 [Leucobacter sp. OH1287]